MNIKLLLLAFAICLQVTILKAQHQETTHTTPSQEEIMQRKAKYLKGLHRLISDKAKRDADSLTAVRRVEESDIVCLNSNFEKIHRFTFNHELNFSEIPQVADIYVDDESIIRVKVLRPATAEEQRRAMEELRKLVEEVTPQSIAREKIIADQLNKPATLFSVMDVDGKNWDLEQLKGKVVVLNFWFIGCAPCQKEMPHLNKFVKKYQDKDVVFLAFEVNNNDPQKVKALTKDSFDYIQIPNHRKDVAAKYQIQTYPTSYVIDKKGKIRYGLAAYNPFKLDEIDQKIGQLLMEK